MDGWMDGRTDGRTDGSPITSWSEQALLCNTFNNQNTTSFDIHVYVFDWIIIIFVTCEIKFDKGWNVFDIWVDYFRNMGWKG